jgi:hypothetical protein
VWFLWKGGDKPLDILCRLSAVCGEKAPACSTVFIWVHNLNSGEETALAAIHEWYHDTLKE